MSKIIRIKKFYVKIFDTRQEMGVCAAFDIIEAINQVLSTKGECNIIFAAAPSQNEVLSQLSTCFCVNWEKVNAFHMDEYIGLSSSAPQGFANFLRNALFNHVKFKSVNCIDCSAEDIDAECARYAQLLLQMPADIVCMGIGENGHIAFNDPHIADFDDPLPVKSVVLDDICRNQQVHDGCFSSLEDVPKQAITLTIPSLIHADKIFCVVPAKTKAQAVQTTLIGDVSPACPASILRDHPHATLYLDADSSSML